MTSEAGDDVGFARTGGQLLAVNGSDRWPLIEANYRWVEETYHQPWFQTQAHSAAAIPKPQTPEWVKSLVMDLDLAAQLFLGAGGGGVDLGVGLQAEDRKSVV